MLRLSTYLICVAQEECKSSAMFSFYALMKGFSRLHSKGGTIVFLVDILSPWQHLSWSR